MKGKDEVMRSSGVLMHISSLPSPYGIGTMGKEARKFADFLEKSGQKYWQILPICPTSYGDSPYQSFSSFAGNPYFIDLEYLCKEKLLKKAECESFPWGKKADKVDYGVMYESRYKLLKIAFERFLRAEPDDFEAFCEKEADWLSDYALFMALKDANGGNAWFSWEKDLKMRKPEALAEARSTYAKDIRFYQMLQYLFFKQWWELKAYVNEKGIEIIGDVPIYVAGDSADVWANPEEFYLDEDLNPIDVAGCPPDAFSEDGQLWGNPLFRWDVMKKNGYTWWTKRIAAMSKLYDIVRIDHFRGFDSYYAIPAKDKTAKNGEWRKGPGMDLFHTLEQKLGRLNIIVEDLGFLTPSVLKLVADSGFPGMKVIQFAFDSREGSNYLPHMTICISSHILEELSKIATDYGIIHNGSLLQEITREELMRRCSERMELTLDHPKLAIPVLDSMGFTNFQVTDKEHIHIFERLNESAVLNMELAKAGIPVKGISITSEELETYFLNLTGGTDHA